MPDVNRRLVSLIRALARPLSPLPTGLQPSGSLRLPVRAVLFDIYGTLFVSRAGGDPALRERAARRALRRLLGREDLFARYRERIAEEHRRLRLNGKPHPEIRIERIWQEVLGLRSLLAASRFAVEYELLADPVWPMPGMEKVLAGLRAEGVLLGTISNAQFLTPLLFPALCGATMRKLGFLPDLVFLSYLEGAAKPSPALFAKACAALERRGIPPDQALFIGNDLASDLNPAHSAGLQTGLFAGDCRSLRPPRPAFNAEPPTVLLTALPQLLQQLSPTPASAS
jgi:putative hydrolase of the HAD superfamily